MSLKSSKQTCIARSIMESEFIALDKAEWLRNFLENILNWPKPVPAVCIHCDSQAAIGRARNVMYNSKSRHMHRRHDRVSPIGFTKESSKSQTTYPYATFSHGIIAVCISCIHGEY